MILIIGFYQCDRTSLIPIIACLVKNGCTAAQYELSCIDLAVQCEFNCINIGSGFISHTEVSVQNFQRICTSLQFLVNGEFLCLALVREGQFFGISQHCTVDIQRFQRCVFFCFDFAVPQLERNILTRSNVCILFHIFRNVPCYLYIVAKALFLQILTILNLYQTIFCIWRTNLVTNIFEVLCNIIIVICTDIIVPVTSISIFLEACQRIISYVAGFISTNLCLCLFGICRRACIYIQTATVHNPSYILVILCTHYNGQSFRCDLCGFIARTNSEIVIRELMAVQRVAVLPNGCFGIFIAILVRITIFAVVRTLRAWCQGNGICSILFLCQLLQVISVQLLRNGGFYSCCTILIINERVVTALFILTAIEAAFTGIRELCFLVLTAWIIRITRINWLCAVAGVRSAVYRNGGQGNRNLSFTVCCITILEFEVTVRMPLFIDAVANVLSLQIQILDIDNNGEFRCIRRAFLTQICPIWLFIQVNAEIIREVCNFFVSLEVKLQSCECCVVFTRAENIGHQTGIGARILIGRSAWVTWVWNCNFQCLVYRDFVSSSPNDRGCSH